MKFIKEPLVHFLIIGGLLFAAFEFLNEGSKGDREIVISQARVVNLSAIFERTWKRQPSKSELDGLIEDYIREEISYREGVAIGLDKNDTIVRRRIKQKFEFIAEDAATAVEPDDKTLEEFYLANVSNYRNEPQYTFKQVFVSDEARAAEVLQQLSKGHDWQSIGDRTLLDAHYKDLSSTMVDRVFGEGFAAKLENKNTWFGPIRSEYGFHLVQIEEMLEGFTPDFEVVRKAVLRDHGVMQRKKYINDFYTGLRAEYQVRVETVPELIEVAEAAEE